MKSKPKTMPQPKEPIPLAEENSEHLPETHESNHADFVMALARGDASTAAKILRELDALHRPVTELLADLLDGDPALSAWFPYRLNLVPRKRGKPPIDYLTKQAQQQIIARAVTLAIPKFKKLDAAIHHVQQQHQLLTNEKLHQSTIRRWYSAHKEKFKKESP